ncbi:COPI associated protein-domain-containing protein [Thamnocephalis sphaerospora]|uniref:COPI associated protein-domain-containing protein n=1 Tax=Thamnocephalis sphaerospora TaxID=78915 RepID=A0A4P9XLS5_9FUNG|nr:COPI associated protein-domain-containing protein [Thamnocephalis sphaerospora]|eukprot:RKP06824.1 COPI associated protein-domain-containing protein [Thamnocephalis sphaerospora]
MARPVLDRFGLALLLSVLNMAVYIVVIIAAIFNLLSADFPTIINNVYVIVLSLCLMVNEFRAPPLVLEYFKFTCTYLGRGLVFFFLGCVVIRRQDFNIAAGIMAASAGVFYFVLSFTPGVPRLAGIQAIWQERRAYFNARKAKHMSQEAERQMSRRGITVRYTTATTVVRQGSAGVHEPSDDASIHHAESLRVHTSTANAGGLASMATSHPTLSDYRAGSTLMPAEAALDHAAPHDERPVFTAALAERRSRVSLQLSQISLPEGATATFEPEPGAVTLPPSNSLYTSKYASQSADSYGAAASSQTAAADHERLYPSSTSLPRSDHQ